MKAGLINVSACGLASLLSACTHDGPDLVPDSAMESPDDEPSLTCQVELRDMRSEQHDAAGEYVNAVEVALHSVEGGSLDSVEATVSWYAQAVVLAFAFDPEGTGGLAGPLPYELDDHFIQAQVLDEHGALEVEVVGV